MGVIGRKIELVGVNEEDLKNDDSLDFSGELPEQVEELEMKKNFTTEEKLEVIKQSIRDALKITDKIQPTNTLVLTLYQVLQDFFINGKRYVICELPTGSGKSVIGYMLHYCYKQCFDVFYEPSFHTNSYFLTSSKMLQNQIENDFDRFNIAGEFEMLKGTVNYECVFWKVQQKEGEKNLEKLGMMGVINTEKEKQTTESEKVMFDKRFCLGMTAKRRKELICHDECPYFQQRLKTSAAPCAVLNYAYFLNVLRSDFNPFFSKRYLTIADEAHLIPDIVCNLFSFEVTKSLTAKMFKFCMSLKNEYFTPNPVTKLCPPLAENESEEENCRNCITENVDDHLRWLMNFFGRKIRVIDDFIEYFDRVKKCLNNLRFLAENGNKSFRTLHNISIGKLIESVDNLEEKIYDIKELATRPEDVYIMSELVFNTDYYKHLCRDMSETNMVKRNFVSKLNHALFMSATLGNTEEYASLLGLEKDTYTTYRLSSVFDFTKSPIFLCNVGWLNYKNFNNNIDKVLDACINVCEKMHPNDNGIIHTSTFKIANMLREKLIACGSNVNFDRYLFYKTPEEKDACVEKMKRDAADGRTGSVVVGPSLYEGLDLRHNEGRFNILVKVPYPGIDDYVRAKMERVPFWYSRVTLEKVVQAIGRTNRAPDDWSVTYLLDSSFEKQIFLVPNEQLKQRVKYLKVSTECLEANYGKHQTNVNQISGGTTPVVQDWDDMDDLPF